MSGVVYALAWIIGASVAVWFSMVALCFMVVVVTFIVYRWQYRRERKHSAP